MEIYCTIKPLVCAIILFFYQYTITSEADQLTADTTKIYQSPQETTPIMPEQLWNRLMATEARMLNSLLQQKQNDIFLTDSRGNSIIHVAAKDISSKKLEVVSEKQRYLLGKLLKLFPKKINYSILRERNNTGNTPVHILLSGSYVCEKTISLFLQYDPTSARVKNSRGKFPDECKSSGHEQLFRVRCAVTDPEKIE